jgi:hypothetical protein
VVDDHRAQADRTRILLFYHEGDGLIQDDGAYLEIPSSARRHCRDSALNHRLDRDPMAGAAGNSEGSRQRPRGGGMTAVGNPENRP